MATIYLRSTDGDDADDGSTWALAKATMGAAITAAGSGGIIYVSQAHSETISTSTTWAFPTTVGNACKVIAVNDGAEPPTATVDKDDATHPLFLLSGSIALDINGFVNFFGIEIGLTGSEFVNAYIRVSTALDSLLVFDKCYINVDAVGSTGGYILIGSSSNNSVHRSCVFNDCDFNLTNGDHSIQVAAGGYLSIRNGKLLGMSSSTGACIFSLDTFGADRSSRIDVAGFDASQLGSDQYVCEVNNYSDSVADIHRIKLPATFAGFTNTKQFQHSFAPPFKVHSYGDGDQYYKFYECGIEGEIEESTAIYRDSGATYDGTNEYSAKMVSSADATENSGGTLRFKLSELTLDLTGAKTLTVHTCQDAGTVLQDDEFWILVEYPDSTDLALGTSQTTRVVSLGAPTNLSASTETWTGDSVSADHRKCAVTISAITGADNAQVTVWACLAKPSTTLYVCPKVEIS
jgi:hypothetical protein